MFNSVLLRKLRQNPLVLSEGGREESNPNHPNKLIRTFSNLQSFYAVKSYRRSQATSSAKAIRKLTQQYATYDDFKLRQCFELAIKSLIINKDMTPQLNIAQACVGEAIYRTFGFYPHDVQYLGARVLLSGQLAEMQTGEGKTVVAAIAATIAAASGAAVHVLSTNEYLATRDCEEMTPLFDFFSISSGSISSEMEIEERQKQYALQICYVSASELVFDVLKDELNITNGETRVKASLNKFIHNISSNSDQHIVPALHFCIVDEADSVLIDEASTPLIISQESESIMEELVLRWALDEARKLIESKDFIVDLVNNDIELLKNFERNISLPSESVRPMWHTKAWQKLILKKALNALHLFHLDEHYIIAEEKIVIVDEATGRPMPDRSWEQGLHQLIELKEGLDISNTRQTIAQITFQRFFKRYILLAGLTGTAAEVSREMWNVYELKVCIIPPNRKNLRKKMSTNCHLTQDDKWKSVADEAVKVAKNGQPVLIGTRSVESSEKVLDFINKNNNNEGLTIHLLNARQNEQEADIVARAGLSKTITIATNMAGRGTDIKLDETAKNSGGLHVILTEHHDSKRIDRQLIGRSARQGNQGSYQEIVCFNDTLLFAHKNIWQVIGSNISFPILRTYLYSRAMKTAQNRAQQRQYEIRMNTLKQDRTRQKQIGFIGKLK
ncbi:hypothetical protein QL898_00020 [Psychrobacter sp. APC 3279]|uniref:preprotein translocase subunit SecA n=1 Tax=Psychrobacter sp. APC 3279 TaxID=3035189 RepID=UPI0025B41334|nr:hypothetical protein [Psychrobacter sp. APC 3279]MDN3440009.1 hypothetical protein [Psychrobacter sp. APC 3279]